MREIQNTKETLNEVRNDLKDPNRTLCCSFFYRRKNTTLSFLNDKDGYHISGGQATHYVINQKIVLKKLHDRHNRGEINVLNYLKKNLEETHIQWILIPIVISDTLQLMPLACCDLSYFVSQMPFLNSAMLSIINHQLHSIYLAIKYLHGCKIIHRDIKLENMLIDTSGQLKLIDFGLAEQFDDRTIPLRCGTPQDWTLAYNLSVNELRSLGHICIDPEIYSSMLYENDLWAFAKAALTINMPSVSFDQYEESIVMLRSQVAIRDKTSVINTITKDFNSLLINIYKALNFTTLNDSEDLSVMSIIKQTVLFIQKNSATKYMRLETKDITPLSASSSHIKIDDRSLLPALRDALIEPTSSVHTKTLTDTNPSLIRASLLEPNKEKRSLITSKHCCTIS